MNHKKRKEIQTSLASIIEKNHSKEIEKYFEKSKGQMPILYMQFDDDEPIRLPDCRINDFYIQVDEPYKLKDNAIIWFDEKNNKKFTLFTKSKKSIN